MATEVQTAPSAVLHNLPVYRQPEESKTEREYVIMCATSNTS
jgi:hypothetical protein